MNKYEKYIEPRSREIAEMCRSGANDKELYEFLGISKSMFYKYLHDYPELDALITNSRMTAYVKVENEMYLNAIGRDMREEVIEFGPDGKVKSKKITTKHVAGDLASQKFILQNRQRDRWDVMDQPRVSVDNNIDLSGLSKEELMKLAGDD